MPNVTYATLRRDLAQYLDTVTESRAPLVITRPGGKGNVVMLAEEEFAGWQETVHLLRSPANTKRLLRATKAADAGKTRTRALVTPAT